MTILLLLLSLLAVQQPGQFGTLSGQLRDAKGAPAAGVRVSASPVEGDIAAARAPVALSNINQTDSEGRYRLENVVPGRYRILAGAVASPSYYPSGTTPDQGRIVTIAAGQTLANLDFTLALSSTVNSTLASQSQFIRPGIVRVDDGSRPPISPAGSSAIRVGIDGDFKKITLGVTGRFSLPMLNPGSYVITLAPLPVGYYLKSMRSGGVDLAKAPFTLSPNLPGTGIEIVLTKQRPAGTAPGTKVSGRVIGAAFPMSSDLVLILNDPSIPSVTYVRADRKDGSFEILDVPPGRYTLESLTFDVAGNDVANLEVPLSKPATSVPSGLTSIQGTVILEDPTIPEFEIGLTPTPAGAATHSVSVTGREFSIVVPEGEYRVSTSGLPKGYAVSVSAGPLNLKEPFRVTEQGIADRMTGTPIITRSDGKTPAVKASITVRLTLSSEK